MRKHKNSRHTERARACSIQRISEEKTPLCVVLLSKKKRSFFSFAEQSPARFCLESNERFVRGVFWEEKKREKERERKTHVIFLGFHIL